MSNNSLEKAPEFVLENEFVRLETPVKYWLQVSRLNTVLLEKKRVPGYRKMWTPKHGKLLEFTRKCISDGNAEMLVTVVATHKNEESVSYQSLFECNGSLETFVLVASFFETFALPKKTAKTRKNTPVLVPA